MTASRQGVELPALDVRTRRSVVTIGISGLVVAAGIAIVNFAIGSGGTTLSTGVAAFAIGYLASISARSGNDRQVRVPPRARTAWLTVAMSCVLVGAGMRDVTGAVASVVGLGIAAFLCTRRQLRGPLLGIAVLPLLLETLPGAADLRAALLGVVILLGVLFVAAASLHLDTFLVACFHSVTIYLLLVVLLYLIGIRAPYVEAYITATQTDFGLFGERWRFPLSNSWVTAPTLAALNMVFAVAYFRLKRGMARRANVWALAVIGLNWFVIIAANGRTHVGIAIALLVLTSGVLRVGGAVAFVLIAQTLWLAPLWWSQISSPDSPLLAAIGALVPSRNANVGGLATLQGRSVIWDVSMLTIERAPFHETLLGWGSDGYIASGASANYASVLGTAYASNYYPPHNAPLEVVFNVGIITSVVLAVWWIAILRFGLIAVARRGDVMGAVSGLLAAAPLLAFTEVAIVPSNAVPTSIVLPAAAAAVVLVSSAGRQPPRGRPAALAKIVAKRHGA